MFNGKRNIAASLKNSTDVSAYFARFSSYAQKVSPSMSTSRTMFWVAHCAIPRQTAPNSLPVQKKDDLGKPPRCKKKDKRGPHQAGRCKRMTANNRKFIHLPPPGIFCRKTKSPVSGGFSPWLLVRDDFDFELYLTLHHYSTKIKQMQKTQLFADKAGVVLAIERGNLKSQ